MSSTAQQLLRWTREAQTDWDAGYVRGVLACIVMEPWEHAYIDNVYHALITLGAA